MTSAPGCGGAVGAAIAALGSRTPARKRPETAAPTARCNTELDERLGTISPLRSDDGHGVPLGHRLMTSGRCVTRTPRRNGTKVLPGGVQRGGVPVRGGRRGSLRCGSGQWGSGAVRRVRAVRAGCGGGARRQRRARARSSRRRGTRGRRTRLSYRWRECACDASGANRRQPALVMGRRHDGSACTWAPRTTHPSVPRARRGVGRSAGATRGDATEVALRHLVQRLLELRRVQLLVEAVRARGAPRACPAR